MIEHNPLNPVTKLVVSRIPLDRDAQLLSASAARSIASRAELRPFRTEFFLYFPRSFYERIGRIENGLIRLPLGGQYASYALRG
jgi:hypothetical protein